MPPRAVEAPTVWTDASSKEASVRGPLHPPPQPAAPSTSTITHPANLPFTRKSLQSVHHCTKRMK
ncbi:hypothetical protein GCM10027176_21770 [Actinoallomurus bryophytorum]